MGGGLAAGQRTHRGDGINCCFCLRCSENGRKGQLAACAPKVASWGIFPEITKGYYEPNCTALEKLTLLFVQMAFTKTFNAPPEIWNMLEFMK